MSELNIFLIIIGMVAIISSIITLNKLPKIKNELYQSKVNNSVLIFIIGIGFITTSFFTKNI